MAVAGFLYERGKGRQLFCAGGNAGSVFYVSGFCTRSFFVAILGKKTEICYIKSYEKFYIWEMIL